MAEQLIGRLEATQEDKVGLGGDCGIGAAALIMAQLIMRYPFHRIDDDYWCPADQSGVPSRTLERQRLYPQHFWNPKTALGQKVPLNAPPHKYPSGRKVSGVRLPLETGPV